jgi:predicted ATPase
VIVTNLSVENYKSLRSVAVTPGPLSVVVGANGSGKSNLADCIDFVSEVYRHGLEVAVARKGGYENIAHRKQRRSKGAMTITLEAELLADDFKRGRRAARTELPPLKIRHYFSFRAKGYSIRAEFAVERERIDISTQHADQWRVVATVRREGKQLTFESEHDLSATSDPSFTQEIQPYGRLLDLSELKFFTERKQSVSDSELFAVAIGRFVPSLTAFTTAVGAMRVFQISPTESREFGVPIPNPELGRFGSDLPAVVDMLSNKHRQAWSIVMESMKRILPGLENIEVDYTPARTLGLFFRETGIGRPWTVAEVSDGTIHTLALLVAIFDPRSTTLVIEEPENSVHPWIIRNILSACEEASKRKQILITTHSPIVMNHVRPENVLVIWRAQGESKLERLVNLDTSFRQLWADGKVATFDYLDSGALPQAIPPEPLSDEGEK